MWLRHEEQSHYCLIRDFSRFLSRSKTHRAQLYFCLYCLHGFRKETVLQEYKQYCSVREAQRIEFPVQGENDALKFKDVEKTLKVPFVIYVDFETINRKVRTCAPNPEQSATTATTEREVCSYSYKAVCEDPQYTKPTVIYRDEDTGLKLIECLLQ